MASAVQTYTWDVWGDELKMWLGINDNSDDTRLEAWLAVAAEACDAVVGHPTDWADEPHPRSLWLGIVEFVRVLYDTAHRSPGAVSIKTGPLAERYTTRQAYALAAERARDYWVNAQYHISRW